MENFIIGGIILSLAIYILCSGYKRIKSQGKSKYRSTYKSSEFTKQRTRNNKHEVYHEDDGWLDYHTVSLLIVGDMLDTDKLYEAEPYISNFDVVEDSVIHKEPLHVSSDPISISSSVDERYSSDYGSSSYPSSSSWSSSSDSGSSSSYSSSSYDSGSSYSSSD